jgi:predicted O-methyltransferase YrrM
MVVTELRRCEQCQLLFRSPTDPPDLGEAFYQEEYRSGFTTDCPDADTLKTLVRDEFRGSGKDFRRHIELLDALGAKPGEARVLDFGASWGYATWQFANSSFRSQR